MRRARSWFARSVGVAVAVAVAVAAALAACGAPRGVRFANAPAASAVDDRRDVPVKPAVREFYPDLYNFDATFHRPVTRALELPRDRRALGINALDEVPDSTWFTNRLGGRALTPEEITRGPLVHDDPQLHKPWTIVSTKVGGTSLGLIVKDAAGGKFLLKFDMRGFPEVETASDVIVDRLLWACGYHVPEDQIVTFEPKDLVLPADAKVAGRYGGARPFTRAELDKELAQIEHQADGRIRGLASRWLDGKPLGGHPAEGTRDDDPNDRIPHELRRDLRGAYTLFAWLDHLDIKEGNFLDMWVEDPAAPGRHYVMHYLVDFGRSLGAGALFGSDLRAGFSYVIDFSEIGASLFTLGLHRREWEHRHAPKLRGVGVFEATTFEPGNWKPAYPAYVPLLVSDRFDQLWAARILIRFTPEQLRAAVDAGQLSDPRAAAYLTDVLVARQRAMAKYVFDRAAPLDRFEVVTAANSSGDAAAAAGDAAAAAAGDAAAAGFALAFDDLALAHRLGADAATTTYRVTRFDRDGRQRAPTEMLRADAAGHVVAPLVCAPDHDGYTIVRIAVERPGYREVTDVHVARDPATRQPRVIGLERR